MGSSVVGSGVGSSVVVGGSVGSSVVKSSVVVGASVVVVVRRW